MIKLLVSDTMEVCWVISVSGVVAFFFSNLPEVVSFICKRQCLSTRDFAACFHYQEEKAIERGILPLLQRATLVQTFRQQNHVCLKEGSIIVPPYAPPQKMQTHLIPEKTPRSIFVYFRGLFYDVGNDPEGGYYARGALAAVWENFKDNPLFDISTEHPTTYYEDMQRTLFVPVD
ncbi:probable beta-1,4-xylosyltransferase IRX10L, partial [Alnus glutinosa]|uniref:probable beta-1,4-xylosyltransferase IRX10L n=1 Tax=Alnus glutinosa TaxID=3517 RepID=UPI002D7669E2